MPTYQYTGDEPVVFTTVKDASGRTWTPYKGDSVVSTASLSHPKLTMTAGVGAPEPDLEVEEEEEVTQSNPSADTPETNESPVAVDESEEN